MQKQPHDNSNTIARAVSAMCLQKDISSRDAHSMLYFAPAPVDTRQEAAIMRRLAGSHHIVQMYWASFAWQDGQEHSYIVLECAPALRSVCRVTCCLLAECPA